LRSGGKGANKPRRLHRSTVAWWRRTVFRLPDQVAAKVCGAGGPGKTERTQTGDKYDFGGADPP
jgi:hypothetical protein